MTEYVRLKRDIKPYGGRKVRVAWRTGTRFGGYVNTSVTRELPGIRSWSLKDIDTERTD